MFNSIGNLLFAFLVLVIVGSVAKKLDLAYVRGKARNTLNLIVNRPIPTLSSEDMRIYKLLKVVQVKCDWAEKFIEERDHRVPQIANAADKNLEAFIDACIPTVKSVDDQFCRSAMYHELSDLLSKAGYFDRAAQLIPLIQVDFLREQSEELFRKQQADQKVESLVARASKEAAKDGVLSPDGQAALAAQNALRDSIKNLNPDDLQDSPEGAESFLQSKETDAKANRMVLIERILKDVKNDPMKIRQGLRYLCSDDKSLQDWNAVEKASLAYASTPGLFEKLLIILGKAGVSF